MSTRSEAFKSEAERAGRAAKKTRTTPAEPTPEHGHVAKKAAYAREEIAPAARPSRRSTRKSANRTKTDTGMVRSEQMKESTPEVRARKSRARAQRVRGSAQPQGT